MSRLRSTHCAVIAVIAVAALLTGCGASASTVTGELNAGSTAAPTTEAPTTEAPTTEAPTTEAPTTEAPTTVPDTTEPDSDTTEPGGSGTLPANVKDAFMQGCVSGAGEAACECVWNNIQGDLSIEALMDAGSTGSVPEDLEQKIVDATRDCLTSSDS